MFEGNSNYLWVCTSRAKFRLGETLHHLHMPLGVVGISLVAWGPYQEDPTRGKETGETTTSTTILASPCGRHWQQYKQLIRTEALFYASCAVEHFTHVFYFSQQFHDSFNTWLILLPTCWMPNTLPDPRGWGWGGTAANRTRERFCSHEAVF